MVYFCQTLEEFKNLKSKISPKSLGLVPTMGNLHQGHLSLLESSLQENDATLVSIYVNPKQFSEGEDFKEYPRTLEDDLNKIETLSQKVLGDKAQVIVFSPKSDDEIYPKGGFRPLQAGKLGKVLEGEIRPTHFDGVITVVHRLFEMFRPTRAYFGKKDYQQLALIKQMAQKENLKTKIIGLPTVREPSGLALSSRNSYLSEEDKKEALALRMTLLEAGKVYQKSGKDAAKDFLNKAKEQNKKFNYLELRNAQSLEEPKGETGPLVVLGNYQMGKTRLLDNLELEEEIKEK